MINKESNDLLVEKGLFEDGKVNDKYNKLYINYKKILDYYLVNKYYLKKYEEMLDNSGLSFVPVADSKKDFYQQNSFMNLKYFYLRNDLAIEKLSLEDIDTIVNLKDEELVRPSSDLINIIKRTSKDVLNSSNGTSKTINYYGGDFYGFPPNIIVFGVRYEEHENNINKDEWLTNYCNQKKLLNKVMEIMKRDMDTVLSDKFEFAIYNDYNIN